MNQQQTNWKSNQYSEISGIQKNVNTELLGQLPFKETDKVLDAGCGDGKLTFLVAKQVAKGSVWGIDSTPSMIRLCNEKLKENPAPASFLVMNLAEIDFENRFDLVFSNSVFHWINKPGDVLKRLYNSLKQGGSLGIQFPLLNDRHPFKIVCHQALKNLKMENTLQGQSFPWYVPTQGQFKELFRNLGFETTKVYMKNTEIHFKEPRQLYKSFDAAGLDYFIGENDKITKERFKQEVLAEIEKMKNDNGLSVSFDRIFAFGFHKTSLLYH